MFVSRQHADGTQRRPPPPQHAAGANPVSLAAASQLLV